MAKQIFQFEIEWRAGDEEFTLEEMSELLEANIGHCRDNKITGVKEIEPVPDAREEE